MKKLLCLFLAISLMLLVSCKYKSSTDCTNSATSDILQISQTASENCMQETDEERAENFVSDISASQSNTIVVEQNKVSKQKSPAKPPAVSGNTASGALADSAEKSVKQNILAQPLAEKIVAPAKVYATEKDTAYIADRIIVYVNGYRNEYGACTAKKRPRLTEYAEYRSRQLTQHFAHDTVDERAAATAIKYGDYFDPAAHGLPGEPYYIAHANEAIAWSDMQGTADEIAKDVARSAVDSSAHWSYVGDNQFGYIGVGVTLYEGKWYVSIVVSETDKFD